MAPLVLRTRQARARIDLIAAAWGGLVGSVGLMAGASRDWPARLAAAALSFGLGGFLAGVRASARRPAHGIFAWIAAYLIHACFIALARVIDGAGGPEAPPWVAGERADWLAAAGWALAFALFGGILAGSWLRPAGRRRHS